MDPTKSAVEDLDGDAHFNFKESCWIILTSSKPSSGATELAKMSKDTNSKKEDIKIPSITQGNLINGIVLPAVTENETLHRGLTNSAS